MNSLTKYKLLAFICAFKKFRSNSYLYNTERDYLLAKKIGISTIKFTEYKKRCIANKYLIPNGEHLQFIGLKDIIIDLLGETAKNWWSFRHVNFYAGAKYNFNKPLWKQIYERIRKNILLAKYRQQDYVNTLLFKEKHSSKNRHIDKSKAFERLSARYSENTLDALKKKSEEANFKVRTGKFHVSKILGCSVSTASALLRKWDGKYFSRTLVYEQFNNLSLSSNDLQTLKNNNENIGFTLRNGVLVRCIGSLIKLNNTSSTPSNSVSPMIRYKN